jgi:hypothetical protein
MKIFRMDDNIKSKGFIKFLELIPFIIICIHISFIIFKFIPVYLYKLILFIFCCKSFNDSANSIDRISKLKEGLNNKSKEKKSRNSKNKVSEKEKKSSRLSGSSSKDNVIKSFDFLYDITNNFTSLMELKKQNEITNDGGLSYINGIKGIAMIFYLFGSVYCAFYS